MLSIIVAMDRNRLIGRGNALPWHLPADLAHFKTVTMGKPIVMGRKTYESIGRPLPGRHNIVISRNPAFSAPGCTVVATVDAALAAAGAVDEVMVIGGAQLYAELLPRAQRIYLTRIEAAFDGDAWFPVMDETVWQEVACNAQAADERNPYAYSFLTLERRSVAARPPQA
ncbi:MAG: type 3 dihydrofolate reductase [Gammaproteobacteria bacterium]|nr:type 3 dihydrofolate reductase [Gammaproteobacteria bacterium]